jgi:hypothetical protein
MKRSRALAIDRYTQIDDIASGLKRILRKGLWPLAILCIAEGSYLFFSGKPGADAFGMIAGSCFLIFLVWSRGGIGLPVLPLLAAQNLAIYASPIVFGHESVALAGGAHVFQAGLEVLIFGVALTAAWKVGMQLMSPSKAISYVLVDVDREGIKGLNRLGFALAGAATLYLLLQSAGLADAIISHLPAGSNSILVAVVAAAATCGFFMIALSFGSGAMTSANRLAFWAILIVNSVVTASSFLLSSVGGTVAAVGIGLFWGSGRMPWRFSIAVALMLSFLNMGKFSMRDRYWSMDSDDPVSDTTLADLPSRYSEWIQASFDAATRPIPTTAADLDQAKQTAANRQSLMDRIDNLQNMLFVIDAEDSGRIEPVHGATYTLIPSLLIPRIFWPDKPRSHEGQILLNVHFGRQDLNSTFKTYVAWGLLPEAYGNYGPIWGSLSLGAVLGFASAWIENKTARKLAISLEGIIGFGLLLNLLNSFEMVASVLVTSTFQNMVPVVFAFFPFVRRQTLHRPEPDAK